VTVHDRPAAVLLIAAAILTIGAFVPVTAVRALIVLAPALVLPGAALLFGLGVLRGRWDPVPTLALCVVGSLAFYPLAGLLIYVVGISLSTVSVVVEVDVFLLLMLALGSVIEGRRGHSGVPLLDTVAADDADGRRWGGWLAAVCIACAAVLVLGLLLLPKQVPAPYTEFYFTGSTARLNGTITVPAGAKLIAPVAVRNRSGPGADYLISAKLDGATFAPDRQISVPKSGTWRGSVAGTVDQPGCLQQLVIDLVNRSRGSKVASLDLWIQVRRAGCPV
jgi:hypothetical protein